MDRAYADTDRELDARLAKVMDADPQARWAMRQGMWAFGVDSPRKLIAAAQSYHLRDGIAERITCPVLVGRAEDDQFFAGQPDDLMAHLTGATATLLPFTDTEGAGAHCQVGAQRLLAARVLDWLDDTFAAD
jgi:pimeloyl-ACP methyl ester carboxylesterase